MRLTALLLLALAACSGPAESPSQSQADAAQMDSVRGVDPAPVGPGPPSGTAYANVQVGDCQVDGATTRCTGEVAGEIVRADGVRLLTGMAIQFAYQSEADFSDRMTAGALIRLHLGSAAPVKGSTTDPVWRVLGVR